MFSVFPNGLEVLCSFGKKSTLLRIASEVLPNVYDGEMRITGFSAGNIWAPGAQYPAVC